jgi:hypothetical protein
MSPHPFPSAGILLLILSLSFPSPIFFCFP